MNTSSDSSFWYNRLVRSPSKRVHLSSALHSEWNRAMDRVCLHNLEHGDQIITIRKQTPNDVFACSSPSHESGQGMAMQLGAGDPACSGSSVEGQERRTWPGAAKHAKLSMWPFVSSSATRPRGSQMILLTPRHVFRTSSISSLLCPGFRFSCSRHSSVVSNVLYQQYAMDQTHHAARWIQICPTSAMPSHQVFGR